MSFIATWMDLEIIILNWDDPERWCGEGDGRRVQDWEHVYTHGGFMLMAKPIQYSKVISLQLK